MLDNSALLAVVAQLRSEVADEVPTLDGRQMTNQAERMINNWLYIAGVVHARNYRMQLGEEYLESNFYIPAIRLCIDYWPGQAQASMLATQLDKQALYKKYKVSFIELKDEDLPHLDEVLARALLRYGIAVY